MTKFILLCCWLFCFSPLFSAMADQSVIAHKVTVAPVIDGIGTDTAWQSAETVITNDRVAKIPIELQVVYTEESIFIKIHFSDSTENRDHKMLEWNSSLKAYRTGSKREDLFSVKWNMNPLPVNFSLNSETPYQADTWLWKAFRTDPVGFADDKLHIFGLAERKRAKKIITQAGKIMFLTRLSDAGKSTYKDIAYNDYAGDTVVRYEHRMPTGSRADVRAKGRWQNGIWTIEFQRKLQTGQPDDIQFNTKLAYTFGVSRYEIAGKKPNQTLEQPNYESGDIGEVMTLKFR